MILLISDNYASQAAGLDLLVKSGVPEDRIDSVLAQDFVGRMIEPDTVAVIAVSRRELEGSADDWISDVNLYAPRVVTLVLGEAQDSVVTSDPVVAAYAVGRYLKELS